MVGQAPQSLLNKQQATAVSFRPHNPKVPLRATSSLRRFYSSTVGGVGRWETFRAGCLPPIARIHVCWFATVPSLVLGGSLEHGCPTWWRIPARNRFKTADGQGWRTTTTTPPAIIPVVLQDSLPRSHRCLANKWLPDARPRGQPPNKVLAQSRKLLLHCFRHGRQGTWPNIAVPKVTTGCQRMWVDPKRQRTKPNVHRKQALDMSRDL